MFFAWFTTKTSKRSSMQNSHGFHRPYPLSTYSSDGSPKLCRFNFGGELRASKMIKPQGLGSFRRHGRCSVSVPVGSCIRDRFGVPCFTSHQTGLWLGLAVSLGVSDDLDQHQTSVSNAHCLVPGKRARKSRDSERLKMLYKWATDMQFAVDREVKYGSMICYKML